MRTTTMTPSTPTRMTRTITTRAICTSEHSSALFSRLSCLDNVSWSFWLKSSMSPSLHLPVIHDVRFSLTSPTSLSTSTCPSPSSSTPLSWCTLTCTPTSTTWTPWKITCATPPRGAYDVTFSLTFFRFYFSSLAGGIYTEPRSCITLTTFAWLGYVRMEKSMAAQASAFFKVRGILGSRRWLEINIRTSSCDWRDGRDDRNVSDRVPRRPSSSWSVVGAVGSFFNTWRYDSVRISWCWRVHDAMLHTLSRVKSLDLAFCLDRPNVQCVVKGTGRGMGKPLTRHQRILRRCVRFLIHDPTLIGGSSCTETRFGYVSLYTTFVSWFTSDSSNSGWHHPQLKSCSACSGEAHTYGLTKSEKRALGAKNLVCDLGFGQFLLEVCADNLVAVCFARRRGSCKIWLGSWVSLDTMRNCKCEHPHRQNLQADLQQSNAYNPFSEKSKKMIQDMGNVELFELCERIPKVQCSECHLYWNQGIVCCTCGHLLRENQSSRRIFRWQLDLLSIPYYVIKKERPHGNRHGKTEEQIKHHIAHNFEKEMHQKRFWWNSRSLPERLNISWISKQHWSNWRSMHPDGLGRAERFHQSHVASRVL